MIYHLPRDCCRDVTRKKWERGKDRDRTLGRKNEKERERKEKIRSGPETEG